MEPSDQLPEIEIAPDRIAIEIITDHEVIHGYLWPGDEPSEVARCIVLGDNDQSLLVGLEDGSAILVPYRVLRKATWSREPK